MFGKSVEEMGCSHKTLLRKEKKAILGKKKLLKQLDLIQSHVGFIYLLSCFHASFRLST